MDVEKTIEFILAQQAQFSVDLANLTASVQGLNTTVQGLKETVQGHTEQIQAIAGATRALIQMSQENSEANKALREDMQEGFKSTKADIQQLTSNMNALIKVVDGLVRRDNGNTGSVRP